MNDDNQIEQPYIEEDGPVSNEAEISSRDPNIQSEEDYGQKSITKPPQSVPTSKVSRPEQPQKQPPLIMKRCMNDTCPSTGPVEVMKVDKGHYQYLCEVCFKQYKQNHYCYYCKQIYFGEDDGESWIECDKCSKWTHADCEQQKGDYKEIKQLMIQATEFPFECPNCRPKPRYEKRNLNQASAKEKQKLKRNDQLLNSYGFYWKLKAQEIQSDLQKMRAL